MGPGFLAAAGRINWVDREGWFDASIFKGDTLVGNFDLMGGAAHLSAWRCLECRLLLIDYGNGVV